MSKRQTVFDMTGGRCYYCGCELNFDDFHMDHVQAKSKGGKVRDNLVPACRDCNIMKCDLSIEEFRNKINSLLDDNIHGRIIVKYYGIKPKYHTFFFEEVENGDL